MAAGAAAELARERGARRPATARSKSGVGAAEQRVAHRAADEPGVPVPRGDLGERGQRAGLAHAGLPSWW